MAVQVIAPAERRSAQKSRLFQRGWLMFGDLAVSHWLAASPDVAFRKGCVGAALRREGWRTVFIAA
jgi:hypothetical protein